MKGDANRCVREGSVEAAWKALDPVLGNVTPVYEYAPNTWGPPEADRIIARYGGWHNPSPINDIHNTSQY